MTLPVIMFRYSSSTVDYFILVLITFEAHVENLETKLADLHLASNAKDY